MTNTLTLLDYTFSLRAGNLAAAQKAADKLGFAPTTADLENINNIYDEKICHYCKSVANYTTARTKEFVKVANSTTKKIETKIKNITKSDELKEIATHIELPSISIEQLSIIRALKKTYTNAQLQEVFPLAQVIQNYAEKLSTEKIQNQVFENFFPSTKEKLQELLQFYQAAEKITQDISNATDIVQAALKNKIWEKDFYRVKEVLDNGTKTIVNQTVFVTTQKFFTEAENLKTRITKYSLALPELASKKYYELVKRLDVYESYISSKYPLAELAEFQTSAMLALHEQTKNSQYYRYFTRFPHEIKINPTNIFTQTLEESKNKIQNTIDEYLQIGNDEYKKLSSAIIKNKKLITDIQTQKKILGEKIKLLQYDLYGNFSDDINLHSASASLSLSAIKNTISNILYRTKPFAENFREIDGQIKSRTNKIAYLAEILQILYQETKLSFLSSALLDSKKEETFLQKINLLASNFINSNNLVSAQYSITQNFNFKSLDEVLEVQIDSETEKNRQNFLYRIFYALPQQKEHVEFIRQNILQNKNMPLELKDLTEQQYKNAFGFTTTEPEKLQNKIKEIQKRYGLPEDGILGNNICYLKKDVGEFFGKQIKSIDTKNYSIANLINNPLPETYIYFFKKSLNFLAIIKKQPRWKFPQINSYYADIAGKPETATTTGIIKHFQNYVQVKQTGVIDKDTLQALTTLLSLGLKNSTEDIKTKYSELETIVKNAKTNVETLQIQKQNPIALVARYASRIKGEIAKRQRLILSTKGDGSALFFADSVLHKVFKTKIEQKGIFLKYPENIKEFCQNWLIQKFDKTKNTDYWDIAEGTKKLSDIELVFKDGKFVEWKEKIQIRPSDGSLLDNIREQYEKYWQIKQRKILIEKEIQNAKDLIEKKEKLLKKADGYFYSLPVSQKSNILIGMADVGFIYRVAKETVFNRDIYFFVKMWRNQKRRFSEEKNYWINHSFYKKYKQRERLNGGYGMSLPPSASYYKVYCSHYYYNREGYDEVTITAELINTRGFIDYYSPRLRNFKQFYKLYNKTNTINSKALVKSEKRIKEILQNENDISNTNYLPAFHRAKNKVLNQFSKIQKIEIGINETKKAKTQIQTNLDNINAQIQQQTNLLLNKSKINQAMLSAEKISEQINFKTSELENAQLSYGRLLLALTELTTQQKTLEDSYNRIKNSFAKKILTSSDPVNNALALASYVPAIAEKVLPNKVVEELKSQGDAALTQAKNFFTSVAKKADTIAKAGANAIMDFKNALVGMDTRIQDWKHKLELWFDSEKRKVEQYAKELRAELSTPEAIEKIRAEMKRDNTKAMAQTLIEIDAISPVPHKTI